MLYGGTPVSLRTTDGTTFAEASSTKVPPPLRSFLVVRFRRMRLPAIAVNTPLLHVLRMISSYVSALQVLWVVIGLPDFLFDSSFDKCRLLNYSGNCRLLARNTRELTWPRARHPVFLTYRAWRLINTRKNTTIKKDFLLFATIDITVGFSSAIPAHQC